MTDWSDLASPRIAAVRTTLRRVISALASGDVEDILALGHALRPLVHHDDIEVRRSVASAAELLPDPIGGELLEILARDRALVVPRNAEKSIERRAVRKKKRARAEERPVTVNALLDEIGKKSEADRRRAERAVRLSEEAVASALQHEFA